MRKGLTLLVLLFVACLARPALAVKVADVTRIGGQRTNVLTVVAGWFCRCIEKTPEKRRVELRSSDWIMLAAPVSVFGLNASLTANPAPVARVLTGHFAAADAGPSPVSVADLLCVEPLPAKAVAATATAMTSASPTAVTAALRGPSAIP